MRANRCGPQWLEKRLDEGAIVVIDGAMGTELESRGVAMHGVVWSATAIVERPDVVLAAHRDYIAAGAEVIITNTFSSARHMLEPAGLGDRVKAVNRSAVELARRAREEVAAQPVAVAGSMCEWVHSKTEWSSFAKLRVSLREQAEILAEAGVDLLTIEMGERPDRTAMAVEVALETGLPVWAGLSCKRDPLSGQLGGFDEPHYPFDDIVRVVAEQPVGMINIMHSTIADTPSGLASARKFWNGPLGVYPESGHFKMPNWTFQDIIAPEDLVAESRGWLAEGVQLVGGCCGLTVAHIAALRRAYPR